jgi:hypothetical protein
MNAAKAYEYTEKILQIQGKTYKPRRREGREGFVTSNNRAETAKENVNLSLLLRTI